MTEPHLIRQAKRAIVLLKVLLALVVTFTAVNTILLLLTV